jgi:ATP-binding cassette subfamily F protein uup
MSEPNVLILDEPTNDLDIQTLEILEEYLDHFDGIVITVSHDRYFLDRIARRIFAFEGNGRIRQYEGGYSDYLNARPQTTDGNTFSGAGSSRGGTDTGNAAGNFRGTGSAGNTAGNSRGTDSASEAIDETPVQDSRKTWGGERKLRFTYKEQKEFEVIDSEIAALEEQLARLEQEMNEAARDYGRLNQIVAEKDETQQKLEEKMERWIYLNELYEKIQAQ